MRAADLGSRRVAIWGLGREGRAAIEFLRRTNPKLPLMLLDDVAERPPPDGIGGIECVFGGERIGRAIEHVDVIVKSPGVSLYRSEIQRAQERGAHVTSLLNLWFAERHDLTTICVTGTKGKSTTASLIAHILATLGRRAALVGNIGVPITAIDSRTADFAVIEVSSYQAADFDGLCDMAILTSLYPEHLDWHRSVGNYFRDKVNLLRHSTCRVLNGEAAGRAKRLGGSLPPRFIFNTEGGFHRRDTRIVNGSQIIGEIRNAYLARPHNSINLCAALATMSALGISPAEALDAAAGFRGLPHRQQELGERAGVLYVDDSISTIPEATIAALTVYAGRPISVIVGGYDRGIDYRALVETVLGGAASAVICLGDSGQRIYELAQGAMKQRPDHGCAIYRAKSMEDAVSIARTVTAPGGVVLLSPGAPSYGRYRDYIERGHDFAAKAGLRATAESGSHSALE